MRREPAHGVRRTRRERLGKLAVLVGFVALTVALVAALGAPARGYELSIYRSTPVAFWAGVGVALLMALVVALGFAERGRIRQAGLLLAASSTWAIVALPVVRGYYFYGGGDALSHLGFARSFGTGATSPASLLHPGVHVTSLWVRATTGFELEAAMVLAVFLFYVVFFAFVALTVRRITGDDRGLAVGLFAALLVLPINNVSTHPIAHPSSQTLLFVPFVFFVLFLYLRVDADEGSGPTAVGVLLMVTSVALVLLHPQEALNVLVIFGSVAGLQFLYGWLRPSNPIADHRTTYFQTAFLGAVFALWSAGRGRVASRIDTLYRSFFERRRPPGTTVADYSGSLQSVGGSLGEMFFKLFLVSFVFSVLAGGMMAATAAGWLDDVFPERNAYGKYLTVAYVPLLVVTGVVFVANFRDHYFRYVGFLMTVVTVLGAAAIARGLPAAIDSASRFDASTVLRASVVLFVLLFPLAAITIHPSPWIYQSTPRISEAKMQGYEASFEYRERGVRFAGIRGGPDRYVQATYGPRSTVADRFPSGDAGIPPSVFNNNLSTHYEEPRYLPVTDTDEMREVRLYEGFRYGEEGFRDLERSPGIDRVYANDGFRLYLLNESQ